MRSTRSLIQTSGRAARNVNGLVIMYADKITKSMQETIDSTNHRREKQLSYNLKHGITPTQIFKSKKSIMDLKENQARKHTVDLKRLKLLQIRSHNI